MKFKKILPHLIYSIIGILIAFSLAYGGATFSRIKTWSTGESLTASDLNAEFNNILNNLSPAGIDDESANDAAAQATKDPYPAGSLAKATSLQEEIQELRYLIAQITGETYWYIDPDIALDTIYNGAVGVNKTNVADANYGTSALTTDYIIAWTSLSAARTATISTEDIQSGTATRPRVMIFKDESGDAALYPITISLENGANIDGAATYVINQPYQSVTLYLNGQKASAY